MMRLPAKKSAWSPHWTGWLNGLPWKKRRGLRNVGLSRWGNLGIRLSLFLVFIIHVKLSYDWSMNKLWQQAASVNTATVPPRGQIKTDLTLNPRGFGLIFFSFCLVPKSIRSVSYWMGCPMFPRRFSWIFSGKADSTKGSRAAGACIQFCK